VVNKVVNKVVNRVVYKVVNRVVYKVVYKVLISRYRQISKVYFSTLFWILSEKLGFSTI